jgi:transcriptional regulator with XRE-family HTH domain
MDQKDIMQKIGKKINAAREFRDKMSQRTLATRTGIKQTVMSRIERGKSAVSVPDLMRIAEALQLPILYFLPGASPFELTDEETILVTRLREIPEDLRKVIYDQAETAWKAGRQLAGLETLTASREEQDRMMLSGIIPPEHADYEKMYKIIAITLATAVDAETDQLIPLLKTGGGYENKHYWVKIFPPEDRTEGQAFIHYGQKPEA